MSLTEENTVKHIPNQEYKTFSLDQRIEVLSSFYRDKDKAKEILGRYPTLLTHHRHGYTIYLQTLQMWEKSQQRNSKRDVTDLERHVSYFTQRR